jgi:hypothetical protein
LEVTTAHIPTTRLQLLSFSVRGAEDDYLPLAIGNTWSYGPAGLPDRYFAREKYRVAAQEGKRWYLEQYAYQHGAPEGPAG